MTIAHTKIEGVGESNCLEYALLGVTGEPGNSRRYTFTFTTQQPCEVERLDENTVQLVITGDREFSDIVSFIKDVYALY